MTYMTLQGDGRGREECGACGVRAGGRSLYAEGMLNTALARFEVLWGSKLEASIKSRGC